jgi:hypothetical protein
LKTAGHGIRHKFFNLRAGVSVHGDIDIQNVSEWYGRFKGRLRLSRWREHIPQKLLGMATPCSMRTG